MPTILRFLSRLVLVLTLTAVPGARAQQMVEGPYQNGMWSPVAFAFHDDDILYVCSRYGLIYVFDNGVMQPNLLLDISEEVNGWRDFGLLGFALDPDFDTNGYYYVSYVVDRHHLLHYGTPSYSSTMDEPFNATIVRVTRFTADAATGHKTTVPGSRFVLFGETPSTGAPVLHESHSCGQLLFGRDGTLLVAIGDGAHFHLGGDWGHNILSYDAQAELDGIITPVENTGVWRSQQLSSCSGKILRLDPATGDGVPSNPFYDSAAPRSARSRIYALGFRNPFRMSLRPGTGSTDPSLGRPGVLYVGDVGWLQHEELDVVSEAGQNFGWPMFEGIEPCEPYYSTPFENPEAPNPLVGASCVWHFRFQDLLHQAASIHTASFPNPCDPNVQVPASIPTFSHTLPVLDWSHSVDEARVPKFVNGVLVPTMIGTPASGVSGQPFRGGASIGGCWHSGLSFPASFGACYYHADYGQGWIRRFEFDAQDQLLAVHALTPTIYPVMLGEDPADHALLYSSMDSALQMRAIRFGIEPPPVARPVANVTPAPNGVFVQLDARASSDPQGQALTYLWNYGSGGSSTAPQFGITLPSTATPAAHPIQLTVTDTMNASHTATLSIPVDNTAPHVAITSFANGTLFSRTQPTVLPLTAAVHDDEHANPLLTWSWRTVLHHNAHEHPEAEDPQATTSTVLSPTPQGTDFFAYSIDLTVTDPLGLATNVRQWLFPDSTGASTAVVLTAPTNGAHVAIGSPVQLEALTTGSVVRVEYYVDAVLVGVAAAPPYTCTWTPTAAGPHTAIAFAVASDGTSSNSRGTTFVVDAPMVTKVRVSAPAADAIEAVGPTNVAQIGTPALPLGDDGTAWVTGLTFSLPTLPIGAQLRSAVIEFTASQADLQPATLAIACDTNHRPRPIAATVRNLQGRKAKTGLQWLPEPWLAADESGDAQRTPDLASLLAPLVANPNWSHDVLFLVRGNGARHAWSYEHDTRNAPVLIVEWWPPLAQQQTKVVSSDGFESLGPGTVDLTANALSLGEVSGVDKLVGLQFRLDLPRDASIESAQVQFTAAGTDSGPAVLTFRIEDVDDATPLANQTFDLSNRTLASVTATWYPPEWPTPGERGTGQRSCDLTQLLQAVLARPGWNPGQRITVLIEGSGARTAAAADAGNGAAPRLQVSWRAP